MNTYFNEYTNLYNYNHTIMQYTYIVYVPLSYFYFICSFIYRDFLLLDKHLQVHFFLINIFFQMTIV